MSTFQLVAIIIAAVWLPVAGVLYFYLYGRRRYGQFRDPEELFYMMRRELNVEGRYMPRLMEELPYILRSSVAQSLEGIPALVARAVNDAMPKQPPGTEATALLMRELAHALYTPLSQIEAAALSLDGPALTPEGTLSLKNIQTSVGICKAVLAAFREQVLGGRTSHGWIPGSLRQAMDAAAVVFGAKLSKPAAVDNMLPETLPGYSNGYILAAALPLLENAIEATESGEPVALDAEITDSAYLLRVRSKSSCPPSNEIYDAGYTTKADHEGMGLSIVKHLLAAYPGASLTHNCGGGYVTFVISLPPRKSQT